MISARQVTLHLMGDKEHVEFIDENIINNDDNVDIVDNEEDNVEIVDNAEDNVEIVQMRLGNWRLYLKRPHHEDDKEAIRGAEAIGEVI
ncbi:hypothetical protein Scep_024407 [Stephania cephalantha]|uniref:Uncharacterized protein n=1 Tax=Stephania cephalantha TaxID=152367 RepID=A0AAP0HX35_9MAGN